VRKYSARKPCLARRDVSCDFLSSFLKQNLDTIRLFQAFFNQIDWHAIGTKRRPASVPVKLGCILPPNQI
jgi:hypothetical protein